MFFQVVLYFYFFSTMVIVLTFLAPPIGDSSSSVPIWMSSTVRSSVALFVHST